MNEEEVYRKEVLPIRPFLWGITKIVNYFAIALPVLFSGIVVLSPFLLIILSQINLIKYQELAIPLEQGFNIIGFAFTGFMFTLFGAVSVLNVHVLYQLYKRSLTYRKFRFGMICSYVCIGVPYLFSLKFIVVLAVIVVMVWVSLKTRPTEEPFLKMDVQE